MDGIGREAESERGRGSGQRNRRREMEKPTAAVVVVVSGRASFSTTDACLSRLGRTLDLFGKSEVGSLNFGSLKVWKMQRSASQSVDGADESRDLYVAAARMCKLRCQQKATI